jgi:hypothetical protein
MEQGNEDGEDEQLDRDEKKVGDLLRWGGGTSMQSPLPPRQNNYT